MLWYVMIRDIVPLNRGIALAVSSVSRDKRFGWYSMALRQYWACGMLFSIVA